MSQKGAQDTGGGASIGRDVNTGGGNVVGRDQQDSQQRNEQRNQQRAGDIYVQDREGSSGRWLESEVLNLSAQVRELTYRLDGIPGQFRELQEEVRRLKNVEITVREDEIIIKPVTPPDSAIIQLSSLIKILVAVFGILIALMAVWFWWQVTYG